MKYGSSNPVGKVPQIEDQSLNTRASNSISYPGKVYAFEFSVLNLALLVKNINANQVSDKIYIVTNLLITQNEFSDFSLQETDLGGALSTFGLEHGQDRKPLQKVLSSDL